MTRLRSAVVAVAVLALGALAPAVSTQEVPPPALRFEQTDVSATLDELRTGLGLNIHNDRPRDLTARLRITELGLKAPGTPARDVPTGKTVIFPTQVDVAAGGTQQVTLKLAEGAQIAAGVYSGQLSVFEPATDSVQRIPFVLTVGRVAPKPAVAKLTIRVVRWVPWGDDAVDVRDPYLPLAVPGDTAADQLDLAKDKPLGLLPGDRRRVVEVTYSGKTKRLSDNVSAAELGLLNAGRPGEYEGSIDTLPFAEGGEVQITVVTTDSIWIAVALLGLGIVPALLLGHWKRVGRTGRLLRHKEATLRSDYDKARAKFKSDSAGKAWEGYDTASDFADQTKAVRKAIKDFAALSDEAAEEARKEIETSIDGLKAHAEALSAFAADLAALDEALDEVERLGKIDRFHDAKSPDVPAHVTNARKLLEGSELTLEDFAARSEDIAAATGLATSWPRTHGEATVAAERLSRFDGVTLAPADKKRVEAAEREMTGVWDGLWRIQDQAALEESKLRQELMKALTSVAELTAVGDRPQRRRSLGERAEEAALGVERVDVARFDSLLAPVVSEVGAEAGDPATELRKIESAIRRGDTVQLIVTAAIAVYTGLQALYLGKVFGDTPADYLAALLWGVTTAGALDLLADALRTRLGGVLAER